MALREHMLLAIQSVRCLDLQGFRSDTSDRSGMGGRHGLQIRRVHERDHQVQAQKDDACGSCLTMDWFDP